MSKLSSDFGTKTYWENVYKMELDNFQDHGDEGDIWFGKSNMKRIIDWLCANDIDKSWTLIDVGCGNGMLMTSLAQAGFQNLTGIDFVQEAIELATAVLKEKGILATLQTVDFLSDIAALPPNNCLHKKYNIVIDKGTYDAIGICPIDGSKRRDNYKNQLLNILETQGIFMIVSCNWTKEELLSHFKGFDIVTEIPTPSVTFGGKTGHTVTSLVFKKCQNL